VSLAWIILLGRVGLSVSASVVQKRLLLGGLGSRTLWGASYIAMLPAATALMIASWRADLPARFWIDAVVSGVLDALGSLAFGAALRRTDLSVFGPLSAFRPVLALVFGWIGLGEVPSSAGLMGVFITVGGAALLMRRSAADGGEELATGWGRMLALRLVGLGLSVLASVFLKRATVAGTAELTLGVWIASGLVCLGCWPGALRSAMRPEIDRSGLLLHAALFFVMQWLTLHVFARTPLAYAFVFFQLGMVLQVIVGRVVFGEPAFGRRLAGCLVMGAGGALIVWRG
jgi:drug/metabolite transporter (DMT)-like permease